MKKLYSLIVFAFISSVSFSQLVISGVLDGTNSGGVPKVVELYATANGTFSDYEIRRYANGSPTVSGSTALGSTSFTGGHYYYLTPDSTAFGNVFGASGDFANVVIASDVNGNGDDAYELYNTSASTAVDVYGEIGIDGTGQYWEYLDSYSIRVNNTGPNTTMTQSEWMFAGPDSLDNHAASMASIVPFGTYTASVSPCSTPSGLSASAVTSSSATLNWTYGSGNSTSNVEWGTSGFTQGSGTLLANETGGSVMISGLSAGTAYEFYVQDSCASASGTVSSWVGPITFTTVAPEPTNHVTNFTASTVKHNEITVDWIDIDTTGNPVAADGYIIFGEIDPAAHSVPVDSTPTANDQNWSDSLYAVNRSGSATSNIFPNLMANTSYNFYIYPYTNSGQTIDYKTDGTIPSVTVTTPSAPDTIEYQDFASSPLGGSLWDTASVQGPGQAWNHGSGAMSMNAFSGGNCQVNDDWLLTGYYDLDAYNSEEISFDLSESFNGTTLHFMVSTDYTMGGNPTTATWDTLASFSSGTSYSASGSIQALSGDSVTFAFRYNFTSGSCSEWSVDNFLLTGYPNAAPCNTPTSLNATNVTDSSAELSWTTGGASMWNIQWDTAGFALGTGNMITATSNNPYTLSGLASGTTYEFYVQDSCSANASSYAGPFQFTTVTPTCTNPTGLSATNVNVSSAQLNWTSGTYAAHSVLEWGPAGFTQGSGTIVNNVGSPHNLTGLSPNTAYEFYVQDSCTGIGMSGVAGPVQFTTSNLNCINPSNLNAMNIASDSATVMWSADTNAISFRIEWGPAGFTQGTGDTANMVTDTMFNITGLGSGTAYEFYVRSNCGLGVMSNYTGPYAFTTICPAPSNGSASNITTSSAELNWTSGGATTWDIEWGTDGFTQGSGTLVSGVTSNPYNLTGLSDTTAYDFYVRDDCGDTASMWTGPISFTTFALTCNDPSNLSTSQITSTSAELNWTTGGSSEWNIEWGQAGFTLGTGNLVAATSSNPYNLSGLTANTAYEFYVQDTCSGIGVSNWVGPISFTTDPIPTIPTFSIAAVTTVDANGEVDSNGVTCKLVGYVAANNFSAAGASGPDVSFPLINSDNTAGITAISFDDAATLGYTPQMGDEIRAVGEVSQFNGLTQFELDSVTVLSTGNTLPAPDTVTALDESGESRLLTFEKAMVVDTTQWSGSGSYNVNLVILSGDTIEMRVDEHTNVSGGWPSAPSSTFNLTGVGGQFDFSSPYDEFYQVFPRFDSDIVPVDPCPTSTNLTVDEDTTSAILMWTSTNANATFEVVWGEAGFTTGNVETATGTSILLTGLDPNTDYEFYVVDQCEAYLGESNATARAAFTTLGTPIGIESVNNTEAPLRLFPNPAVDGVVQLNKMVSFKVIDVLGHVVMVEKETNQLNVSALESGMYLIRTEEGEISRLVIK